MKTYPFDASYFVYGAFMTSWCMSYWVPRVWSGCVRRADFFFFVFPCSFWPFISHFSLLFLFLRTPVNTKFPNCRKSDNWKEIWFANINLYWWIMSTISISILLRKNTLWFYLLWTWLKQEIFLTLVGRWIEWSSQQISSFELIRDLLFFKSSNVKARRLKSFGALEAWSVELQRFGFVEVYGGLLA